MTKPLSTSKANPGLSPAGLAPPLASPSRAGPPEAGGLRVLPDLAERVFAIDEARNAIEDELRGLLTEAMFDWSDYTVDWYDRSIEVYGCKPTPEHAAPLYAAGFQIVWLHDHTERRINEDLCKCAAQPKLARPPGT